jgi:hypothetical protein
MAGSGRQRKRRAGRRLVSGVALAAASVGTFTAQAAAATEPTLHVTPNEGLRDGDIVTVRTEGVRKLCWGSFHPVCAIAVRQCGPGDHCTPFQDMSGTFEGGYTAQVAVQRAFVSEDGADVDCYQSDCYMHVWGDVNVEAPISMAK